MGASQTRLYVARHARPELPDGEKRFLGQSNLPIGTVGLLQAQALSARLRSATFAAVYSSDLARCRATAEVIAEDCGIALTIDTRLREIDTGLWEGMTAEEARNTYPREYAERENDVLGVGFPGGESFRELRDRVLPVLGDILSGQGKTVLVVAHLGVNRVMLTHLRGLPFEQLFSLRQDYCDFETITVAEGA